MHEFHYDGSKLYCEGVALETLARKYGTPLYIYSQRTLTEHFQKLDRAMGAVEHLVCFATKSNSNLSVLRTLANLGSGFDIVSGGELQRVIAAGGDPRKCVFAGVGKTEAEITFALRQNVYSFNAESGAETQERKYRRRPLEKKGACRHPRQSKRRSAYPQKNHHRHL
jgi:diaminopimelate decarboxylase